MIHLSDSPPERTTCAPVALRQNIQYPTRNIQ